MAGGGGSGSGSGSGGAGYDISGSIAGTNRAETSAGEGGASAVGGNVNINAGGAALSSLNEGSLPSGWHTWAIGAVVIVLVIALFQRRG